MMISLQGCSSLLGFHGTALADRSSSCTESSCTEFYTESGTVPSNRQFPIMNIRRHLSPKQPFVLTSTSLNIQRHPLFLVV
eukprot:scaffold10294_cov102-Skeletonema_dohrnii-CCMP3373.AAC.1